MAEPLPIALLGELAGPAEGAEERVRRAVAEHPTAASALEPLGELLVDADCDIVLTLCHDGRRLDAVGLLGPAACILVAPTEPGADAGWWQVAAMTGAPRLVASAVGLCPRGKHPHDGRVLPLPTAALTAACGLGGLDDAVDELATAMAADDFPAAAVRAILSAEALLWTLTLATPDDEEPVASVCVVDTSRHGLWLVGEGSPEVSLLTAANPTDVWRTLCAALAPTEADPALADV